MNVFEHYKNIGKVFSRLTITHVYKEKSHFTYRYKCECGKEGSSIASNILKGFTKSCGCLNIDNLTSNPRGIKHGMCRRDKRSVEWLSFNSAKKRCNNKNDKDYLNYGGRGIMFLFDTFEEFYKHIGNKPTTKHQLDRINNDGHYEPGNIRWATSKENNNNRRNSPQYK